MAVLLDFVLQVTAFVALIVFDFIRAEAGRVDCVPCIKISPSNDPDKGMLTFYLTIILLVDTDLHHFFITFLNNEYGSMTHFMNFR